MSRLDNFFLMTGVAGVVFASLWFAQNDGWFTREKTTEALKQEPVLSSQMTPSMPGQETSTNSKMPPQQGMKFQADGKAAYLNATGRPHAHQNERIESLYWCMFERAADPHGLATNVRHWGAKPHARAVELFLNFPEYKQMRKPDREFVRDLFQALLGREPGAEELARWIARCPGRDRIAVFRDFVREVAPHTQAS